jgi:hypothetical protein
MTDAEAEGAVLCPVCRVALTATQVFVRAGDDRLHVECFFVLKAEGKLPKAPTFRARDGS